MFNFYNKKIYKYRNKSNINNKKMFMNDLEVPVNSNIGYLQINVSSEQGRVTVPNPFVTVYARGDEGPVIVFSEVINDSSVTLSLPVAHPQGTLIRGPEYYFTTYDVSVTSDGFAPYRCNNLRLFEGINTKLDVCMTSVEPGQYPVPEQIVDIPPHPRDQLNSLRNKYLTSFK